MRHMMRGVVRHTSLGVDFKLAQRLVDQRLEIQWVNIYRVRRLIQLMCGCDPVIFDQSPYHTIETGPQNKKTRNIQGSNVRMAEGKSDARSSCKVGARRNLPVAQAMFLSQHLTDFPDCLA